MTRRYTGGFISATEQATDANTANGIYTLSDAAAATAAGNFPVGRWTPPRSLRLRGAASAYLNRTMSLSSPPAAVGGSLSTVYNFTISADTNSYSLQSEALRAGWNGKAAATFNLTIAAGVVVGSGSSFHPALDLTGFPTGVAINVTVGTGAQVVGAGGAGGAGGASWGVNGAAGAAGGDAIWASVPVTIVNNGTIAGGGGGGGGGGGSAPNGNYGTPGGSGGGGAGRIVGAGAGPLTATAGYTSAASGAGTLTTGGTGTSSPGQGGGLGGNGGNLGAAGTAGQNGQTAWNGTTALGGAAGAAGFYAKGNTHITWSTAGTRLGQVQSAVSSFISMTTFTYSTWVKRGSFALADDQWFFGSGNFNTSANEATLFEIQYKGAASGIADKLSVVLESLNAAYGLQTTAVYRDPSAWYHIVTAVDTNQSVSSERVKVYVNGDRVTSFSSAVYPPQGIGVKFDTVSIGSLLLNASPTRFFDGYLAEPHLVDGQQLTPASFGMKDPITGTWVPKYYNTIGPKGFYLDFADASSVSNLCLDRSGSSNNFTGNNVSVTAGTTYDAMVDVPGVASALGTADVGGVVRGNYATLNPLSNFATITNGNLTMSTAVLSAQPCTVFQNTGKWYWEVVWVSGPAYRMGVCNEAGVGQSFGENANTWVKINNPPRVYNNSSTTSYGTDGSVGDTYMFALDLDAGMIWYGINGVWQANGSPSTRTLPSQTFTPNQNMTPAFASGTSTNAYTANFGQRPFAYTPPTGFKSLNTTNFPNPVIRRPEQHFDVKTYTGNGSNITIGTTAKQTSAYAVEESLRFNASNSGHLTRTPTSVGNRKTWSYSAWIKRTVLGTRQSIFSAGTGNLSSAPGGGAYFTSSTNKIEYVMGGGTSCALTTTQSFTNPTSWMHLLIVMDTTQASPINRVKIYVDGVQLTSFDSVTYPSQNFDTDVNNTVIHSIGSRTDDGAIPNTVANYYLAEVNFIDGSAKVPSDFGAFDANNNWVPQRYTGTYGTNGFYLPTKHSGGTGFNAVTFTPITGINKIGGVGFNPDLVWMKRRNSAQDHFLIDSVRDGSKLLRGNQLNAETTQTNPNWITSFDADGFTTHSDSLVTVGVQYVAWCWDAGTTTVSNTSGTITSSVRANTTNGFSIVTYTGNGTGGATVGHGLGVTPSLVLIKNRSAVHSWHAITAATTQSSGSALTSTTFNLGSKTGGVLQLNTTNGYATYGMDGQTNDNTNNYVAYCFSEVAGFSKFGTYSGNGSSTGPTITTGFRPAFVMVKRTDTTGNWVMFDSTRSNTNPRSNAVSADLNDREYGTADGVVGIDFTANGFQLRDTHTTRNATGGSYFYVAFAETRANVFGKDNSTNTNDWQPGQGFGTVDVVLDSPTDVVDSAGNIIGNYPTLISSSATISNTGLRVVTASGESCAASTLSMTTGKWYFEASCTGNVTTGSAVGIAQAATFTSANNMYEGANRGYGYYGGGSPGIYTNVLGSGNQAPYGASWTTGDTIGCAFDADIGTLQFFKNGVSQGVYPGVVTNIEYRFAVGEGEGAATASFNVNFGQLPFIYTPPAGFNALNTKNLKDVGSFNLPDSFGNQVTTPDLVWLKARNTASYGHRWTDTVRGPRAQLLSHITDAQSIDSGGLQAFLPNGFQLGSGSDYNANGTTYVSWMWNRGTLPGFEIARYAGNGASSQTIQHNLGVTPAMMIVKSISSGVASWNSWNVWHRSLSNAQTSYIRLNEGNGVQTSTAVWGNLAPTNNTFSVGNNAGAGLNGSGDSFIAYLWAEVPGFSKFGSYVGNGSSDGPFINLGFKPKFVMTKAITAATRAWCIYDGARNTFNLTTQGIVPNSADAEFTGSGSSMDFVSNGFKPRGAGAEVNVNNETYIYVAFADSPFKYANAR
jgi:hypothetical protein